MASQSAVQAQLASAAEECGAVREEALGLQAEVDRVRVCMCGVRVYVCACV